MADMWRLTVRMDGWPGAPGFMTFYSKSSTPFRAPVIAFIDDVKSGFPATVSFTVPNTIDVLDDATGSLTGVATEGTEYVTTGSVSEIFSAPSGVCISWITNAFVSGRRVRGRTFLVPLIASVYQADGTIATAALTSFRDAAVDLFTACDLAVWHRPTTPGGSDGAAYEVTGSQVSDRAAVLRSRRS